MERLTKATPEKVVPKSTATISFGSEVVTAAMIAILQLFGEDDGVLLDAWGGWVHVGWDR